MYFTSSNVEFIQRARSQRRRSNINANSDLKQSESKRIRRKIEAARKCARFKDGQRKLGHCQPGGLAPL